MADPRKQLESLLESLGETSLYVTSGSLPPVLPGLTVEGIDSIGSPIAPRDAKRLISAATQAPYGQGEKTILDTDVRRVWQLEPGQFTLENPDWADQIRSIVDSVRKDFAIEQPVKAALYKLLIYEEGSFFVAHRDTEKLPRMFATLVVCLPSRHEGGSLIVRHDGQTNQIDFGGKESQFKTQYAAFYSDCEHEVKPVTSGYRICLIYNLAIAGKKQPTAPVNSAAVTQAANLLAALFSRTASPISRLAIPLLHQYSEAGLDPRQLKGADVARADVLARAAAAATCECHLALLTLWQSGTPDYSTMDYDPYARRSYRDWYEDEDEDKEDEESDEDHDVALEEVFEERLTLNYWLDLQGHQQPWGEFKLDKQEVLNLEDRSFWSRKQQIEEATGNAGASMELWYRQGAIVIWPSANTLRILAGEGPDCAVPELERRMAGAKSATARKACGDLAWEIVQHWTPVNAPKPEAAYSTRMLRLLEQIGDRELICQFVDECLPGGFVGEDGEVLARLAHQVGWDLLGPSFVKLLEHQDPERYLPPRLLTIVAMFRPVCGDPPPLSGDRLTVCEAVAQALRRVITRWDSRKISEYGGPEAAPGVVEGMVRILSAGSFDSELDWFISHVFDQRRRYDLHTTLIPDVKAICQWLSEVPAARPAAKRLLEHCLSQLREATAQPVNPPQDWARGADLDCKCADCRALAAFLRDPAAKVGRFAIRADRRGHLHRQIERHACDCTHVTERRGSPQTLVCTKTQASYERKRKQYQVDQELLAELEKLKPDVIRSTRIATKKAAKSKGTEMTKRPARKKPSKRDEKP